MKSFYDIRIRPVHTTIIGGDKIPRTLLRIPGSINRVDGFFEYIIEQDGQINHREFIK
jgi:hypothetical protein